MSKKAEKKEEVIEPATVKSDYADGITNFRVLAKKHGKTVKQINAYLNK